jgi:hypothetical protein
MAAPDVGHASYRQCSEIAMSLDQLPAAMRARYHVEERRHACAILASDFPAELNDLAECLADFRLLRSEIEEGGGRKSKIASRFDDFLAQRGWEEKNIKVGRIIGDKAYDLETRRDEGSRLRLSS